MSTASEPLRFLSPVTPRLSGLRPVRGEGVHLFDEAGERWTDFTSGIGDVNTGHAHPRVVAAVRASERTAAGEVPADTAAVSPTAVDAPGTAGALGASGARGGA